MTPAERRTRIGMAAGLAGMTVLHIAMPEPFEDMIPHELPGTATTLHWMAIIAEATAAGLLARRSTANLGGVVAFLTFLGVWIANVEAVRRGGYPTAPGFLSSRWVAIARVPLQLPLLWMAWRVATSNMHPDTT